MKILKVVLAIYLGIYLILPVCLCQTLAAFGIFVHGLVETDSETIVVFPHEKDTFPCHCDDHVCKNANVPQDWDESEQTTPDESPVAPLIASTRKSEYANQKHPRAPPPPTYALSKSAAVSCVFLI